MKKCLGCHQDVDKYAIACQYCGKVLEVRAHEKAAGGSLLDLPTKGIPIKKAKKAKRAR